LIETEAATEVAVVAVVVGEAMVLKLLNHDTLNYKARAVLKLKQQREIALRSLLILLVTMMHGQHLR
jgi:hypothetical protein